MRRYLWGGVQVVARVRVVDWAAGSANERPGRAADGRPAAGDGCRVPHDGCEQKAECKTESSGGAEGGGAGAR